MALDAMYGMQARFYYRYQLLSAVDRRAGGQGVVQFAAIVDTMDKVRLQLTDVCRGTLEANLPIAASKSIFRSLHVSCAYST